MRDEETSTSLDSATMIRPSGKWLILLVVAVLVGGLLLTVGSLSNREPSARITFRKARFETNGTISIAYVYDQSSGTFLRSRSFIGNRIVGDGGGGGYSLFGLLEKGTHSQEFTLNPQDLAGIEPAKRKLLVLEGKTYQMKLYEELCLYSFTNASGEICRAYLLLELFRKGQVTPMNPGVLPLTH